MTTRGRIGVAVLALAWLALELAWVFDLGVSGSPILGWLAFLAAMAPPVLALHWLGKRLGAKRSRRRFDDA